LIGTIGIATASFALCRMRGACYVIVPLRLG